MLDLMQLAQDCAPEIPPAVIVAIAQKESSGNRFALGHPDYPPGKQPRDFGAAVRAADELAVAGQRYDLGLMQISSANFDWLGLDNVTALDPCKNMAAAQTVLLENLRLEGGKAEAFFNSLSRYNSGNKTTGYRNGYVTEVAVQLLNPPQEGSKMAVKGEKPTTSRTAPEATPSIRQSATPSAWEELGNTQDLFALASSGKNTNISHTAPKTSPSAQQPASPSAWEELGNTQDLFALASSGKNTENGNIFHVREDEVAHPEEAHRLQRVARGD